MKNLQLWKVRWTRRHKTESSKGPEESMLLVLPNNTTPEKAIEATIDILKERETFYRGYVYEFILPDRDADVRGCHIPSNVEKEIVEAGPDVDFLPPRVSLQMQSAKERKVKRASGEFCWFDEGPEPIVMVQVPLQKDSFEFKPTHLLPVQYISSRADDALVELRDSQRIEVKEDDLQLPPPRNIEEALEQCRKWRMTDEELDELMK